MILDSLTHVTPNGKWFKTSHDASEKRLLGQLEEAKVSRAVVVALAEHIENRFVLEVCKRHPQRLIPCASFNPAGLADPAAVPSALRAELKESEFKALKLHPRLNQYDPLDPRCLAVLDEVASWEHPLPIWLDTLFYFREASLRKPLVDTIHELVSRFSTVPFVLLHGGGSWILQVAEAIRDCPNAFLDISFTLHRYRSSSIEGDIRYLVNTFDRRLVFGSDFPEIGVGSAIETFREIAHGLPAEKCNNVLGANLSRILNLE